MHGKFRLLCTSLTNITIRTFQSEDMNDVREIEKASFPDPFSRFLFKMLKLRTKEGFIVACDERVIGYAIAEIRKGRGHIISMAVAQDDRRKGVGKALLQDILWRLDQKVDDFYLEVKEDNTPAIRLYEGFAFRKTGEVKERYYPGGEAAIIMVRPNQNLVTRTQSG